MKRAVALLMIMLVLLSGCSPAKTGTAAASARTPASTNMPEPVATPTVYGTIINVDGSSTAFAEMSRSSAALYKVKRGETVTVLSQDGEWYLIEYGGEQAYMQMKYVDADAPVPQSADGAVVDADALTDEDFMASCKEYNYKDLMRNPDVFIGAHVVLTVKISQIVSVGFFDVTTAYRCYTDESGYGFYFDDEYYIADGRESGSVKLLEDDIILVYGVFDGVTNITRALTWTKDELPQITMRFCKIIDE